MVEKEMGQTASTAFLGTEVEFSTSRQATLEAAFNRFFLVDAFYTGMFARGNIRIPYHAQATKIMEELDTPHAVLGTVCVFCTPLADIMLKMEHDITGSNT